MTVEEVMKELESLYPPIKIGKIEIASKDWPEMLNWEDTNELISEIGKGWRLPTPEETRQSEQYPYQKVTAWAAGKTHEFNIKVVKNNIINKNNLINVYFGSTRIFITLELRSK